MAIVVKSRPDLLRWDLLVLGMSLVVLGNATAQQSSVPTLRERLRSGEVSPLPEGAAQTLSRARSNPVAINRGSIQEEFVASQAGALSSTIEFFQGERIWACGTLLRDRQHVATKASRFQGVVLGERIVGKFEGQSLPLEVVKCDPNHDLLILQAASPLEGEPWSPSLLLDETDANAWVGALVACGDQFGIVSVVERPVSLVERTAHEARVQKFHDRMKVRLSERRSDFPAVIETDLPLSPEDVGRPVIDLDGRVIGIAIARATLNASYVLPLSVIE